MKRPDRWQEVKAILHSALQVSPAERASFLDKKCGDDLGLRGEIESLIASHDGAAELLESSVPKVLAAVVSDRHTDELAGRTLGHYEVIQKLGAGGMGEVYLARDTTLGRNVALKLLPVSFTQDGDRLGRFQQEARTASALNHPNILTVHEIGNVDSLNYIATEYVDGETLRDRTNRAPLKITEALDIATQVASALATAHEAGIIHRDIKPENIMLRRDGFVKVLDFGLAKLTERPDGEGEALTLVNTGEGIVIGTAQYMSPEQARGQPVDARTDIWSLGCVLYELLANRAPFTGPTTSDVIVSILDREPPPLTSLARGLPAEVDWIVKKSLRKDRDERYQTSKEFLSDLRSLKHRFEFEAEIDRTAPPELRRDTGETQASGGHSALETISQPLAHPTSSAEYLVTQIQRHKRSSLFVLVTLALAATAATYSYFLRDQTPIDSMAVLPFVSAGADTDPDAEYLSDGITEGLTKSLSQLPNMRMIARASALRYRGRDVDPRTAARELGVQAVLIGSVVRRGDSLSISAELVDARDNSHIWGEQYNRSLSDVLVVQKEIARAVADKLRTRLTPDERRRVTSRYTENSEAYQLYMKGRFFWDKRTVEALTKAVGYFKEAVEKDPSFALAYVGLADSYSLLSDYGGLPPNEAYPQARSAALRALALDERLAEAHAALGLIKTSYDWDWTGAEMEYRRAIELNPEYETAHQWYAEYLSGMGRHQEAIAEIRRAKEINPVSLIINAVEVSILCIAREYDQGIAQGRKALEMDPYFAEVYGYLKRCYDQKGMYREAVAAHQMARKLAGLDTAETAALREAAAATSATVYWQKRLEQKVEESKKELSSGFEMAEIYAQLGEKDQAFRSLEHAYEKRSVMMMYVRSAPNLDPIRADPRYADLLRRMGLSEGS